MPLSANGRSVVLFGTSSISPLYVEIICRHSGESPGKGFALMHAKGINPIHPQTFSREGGAARPMKPLHCDLCGSGATAFPPWCAPPSSRAWAPRAGDASAPASGSALPPARAARNARAARFADRRGDGAEGEREYWKESGVPAAGWGQPTGRTPGPIRPILFACVLVGVLPGYTDTNGRKRGPPQGHSTFLLGQLRIFHILVAGAETWRPL